MKQLTTNKIQEKQAARSTRVFALRKPAVSCQLSVVSCSSKGFTLVELLISISILLVMTGAVLASYRGYNNNAYFANASEDIVLALRQAQVYGVGVKGDSGSFDVPYGVYFDMKNSNKNKMVLFADTNLDRKYTAGTTDKPIETISWSGTIGITGLACQGTRCLGDEVSITFKRPNPDARIVQGGANTTVDNVIITIGNGSSGSASRTSSIKVTETGQIYFQ